MSAVEIEAIKPAELERVIVDTTVLEKAIAHHLVGSSLLEITRHKVVSAAKRAGIALKQTFAKKGKELRRKAGGYAHAKQFRRLKKVVKRQRTILGVVMREVQRKLDADTQTIAAGVAPARGPSGPSAISDMMIWLERAERIRAQQRHDKNKLYALPEVECIGKGKARKPYEFGVRVSLAVTHKSGLMVGARSFPGNPCDGHILAAQLEQTTNLLLDLGRSPTQAMVDLGFRGMDADNPGVEIIRRARYMTLAAQQKRWLKRRQAIEPMIGHYPSPTSGRAQRTATRPGSDRRMSWRYSWSGTAVTVAEAPRLGKGDRFGHALINRRAADVEALPVWRQRHDPQGDGLHRAG